MFNSGPVFCFPARVHPPARARSHTDSKHTRVFVVVGPNNTQEAFIAEIREIVGLGKETMPCELEMVDMAVEHYPTE